MYILHAKDSDGRQPDPANATDVVEVLPSSQELGLQKLWITFGYGTHQFCIGLEKTSGFHACQWF